MTALYRCAHQAFIVFLLASSVTSASAQLFNDDVARETAKKNAKQLKNLTGAMRLVNKKTDDLEKRVKNIQKNLSSLTQQLQGLNEKVNNISGLLEEQREQLKSSKKNSASEARLQKQITELKSTINDINTSMQEISGLVSYPSEQELYDKAFAMFKQKEYDKAVQGFQRILRIYPGGAFNANAEYWSALALYNIHKFEDAIVVASNIAERYANSDKIPDAKLIVVRALRALKKENKAQQVLAEIMRDYPTSLAADKARQLLAE